MPRKTIVARVALYLSIPLVVGIALCSLSCPQGEIRSANFNAAGYQCQIGIRDGRPHLWSVRIPAKYR